MAAPKIKPLTPAKHPSTYDSPTSDEEEPNVEEELTRCDSTFVKTMQSEKIKQNTKPEQINVLTEAQNNHCLDKEETNVDEEVTNNGRTV